MASEELEGLRERVEKLERETAELRQQLAQRSPWMQSGPPPIIEEPRQIFERAPMDSPWAGVEVQPVPEQQPSPAEPLANRLSAKSKPSDAPAAPKPPTVDTEFKFGSQVLPRVGIVIVLLGILYLVAYAIQNRWITLQIQFVGELLLCGALIGVGVWKLNEREDFGQVLVGGGSCGLYLSFAGGHVYKNLYSGDVLVVLFLALSLANLGFSWWRSSKTFWAIGFVGGLVGAALPMDKNDHASTLVLAGVIVAAATALAGYRKWLRAIEALWLVSVIFVKVVLQDALDRNAISVGGAITVFYLFSLLPITVHALRFVPSEFDPNGWFVTAAGGATALATLVFGNDHVLPVPHSVAVVAFSLALGCVAWSVRKAPHGKALTAIAIACATVVAPLGFMTLQACLTYAGLGILASLFAHARREGVEKPAALFSGCYVVLSILAYAFAMGSHVPPMREELLMLGAIAVGIANCAAVFGRLDAKMAEAVTVGAVVFYPVLARASYVSASSLGSYSVLFGTAAYALVLALVSLKTKWPGPALVAMALTVFSTFIYWADASGVETASQGRQIAALALMSAALVLSALGSGRDVAEKRTVSLFSSILGCLVVVPLVGVALELPYLRMAQQPAIVVSLCTYALLLALVTQLSKWSGNAVVGTVVAVGAVAFYAMSVDDPTMQLTHAAQLPLVAFVCVAMAATAMALARNGIERQQAWTTSAFVGWYLVSRLFYLVLVLPAVAMHPSAASALALALYSSLLAGVSLWRKWPGFAYIGSGVALSSVAAYWAAMLAEGANVPQGQQLVVTLVTSVAIVLCTLGSGKDGAERKSLSVLSALVGWFVLARAIALVLIASGMQEQAALSTAWSLYAALVLALGFLFDAKPLRITSLVVFGVTIAKVMLVDLASLQAYIRIIVLIVLGLLLILGGYVYVRQREDGRVT